MILQSQFVNSPTYFEKKNFLYPYIKNYKNGDEEKYWSFVSRARKVHVNGNGSLRPTCLVSVSNIASHFQNLQLIRLFISRVMT